MNKDIHLNSGDTLLNSHHNTQIMGRIKYDVPIVSHQA